MQNPPLVTKQGTTSGQVGMQANMVPMTIHSSRPGSIPNVMTINKPGGQKVVVTTQNIRSGQPAILPSVQILNMRPGEPTVAAQKSVATVCPRVLLGTPHVVCQRAAVPGITLQTLQSLQQGQHGHLLLKTKNGQYQLLKVGPAPAASSMAPQPQTLGLSTVPAAMAGGTIAVLQNIPVHPKINVSKVEKTMTVKSKVGFANPSISSNTGLPTVLPAGKSLPRDRERGSAQFSMSFVDDKMADEDDINDVAAMGGVNLAEESQRILGSSEMIGAQIRSCKDETLMPMAAMQSRVRVISAKQGLEDGPPEVSAIMSHAVEERLKTLLEKLAVITQQRIDSHVKMDPRYDVTQDVKGQLKFLEEVDRVHKKRREDAEREMLLRAAKSRSENEDPEQVKLKAKAKEMQRAELEELRQRETNWTALQAIGPRKRSRTDRAGDSGDVAGPSGPGVVPVNIPTSGRGHLSQHARLRNVNMRDMLFMMEQQPEYRHSVLLYRAYLK